MTASAKLRELHERMTPGQWQAIEPIICKAYGGEEIASFVDAESGHATEDADGLAALRNALPEIVAAVEAAEHHSKACPYCSIALAALAAALTEGDA